MLEIEATNRSWKLLMKENLMWVKCLHGPWNEIKSNLNETPVPTCSAPSSSLYNHQSKITWTPQVRISAPRFHWVQSTASLPWGAGTGDTFLQWGMQWKTAWAQKSFDSQKLFRAAGGGEKGLLWVELCLHSPYRTQKLYGEVPTPGTSACDLIWK